MSFEVHKPWLGVAEKGQPCCAWLDQIKSYQVGLPKKPDEVRLDADTTCGHGPVERLWIVLPMNDSASVRLCASKQRLVAVEVAGCFWDRADALKADAPSDLYVCFECTGVPKWSML